MSCQYCTSCGAPTEPLPSGPEAPSAVPLPEAPAQGAAPSSLPPTLCSPEEPVVPHPAAPAQGASVQEQAPPPLKANMPHQRGLLDRDSSSAGAARRQSYPPDRLGTRRLP